MQVHHRVDVGVRLRAVIADLGDFPLVERDVNGLAALQPRRRPNQEGRHPARLYTGRKPNGEIGRQRSPSCLGVDRSDRPVDQLDAVTSRRVSRARRRLLVGVGRRRCPHRVIEEQSAGDPRKCRKPDEQSDQARTTAGGRSSYVRERPFPAGSLAGDGQLLRPVVATIVRPYDDVVTVAVDGEHPARRGVHEGRIEGLPRTVDLPRAL